MKQIHDSFEKIPFVEIDITTASREEIIMYFERRWYLSSEGTPLALDVAFLKLVDRATSTPPSF